MSTVVLLFVYSKKVVPSVLRSLETVVRLYPDDQIVEDTLGEVIEKMSLTNVDDLPVTVTSRCALLKLSGGNISIVKTRIISFMCKNTLCRAVSLGSETNQLMSQILGSKSNIRRQRVLQFSGFELSQEHHFSFDDIILADWSKLLKLSENTDYPHSSTFSGSSSISRGDSQLIINETIMERRIIVRNT
ncbi:U12-like protein [Lissonota sp. PSUC_FEM 10030012]|nr:U12-like protein [Lissonota sp. PSUC_FEM 10030012]